MEAVKNAVFTACLCAVLASAVRMISPERMKNEIRLVSALLIMICAASQIMSVRPELEELTLSFKDDSAYERLLEEYSSEIGDETKNALESAVMNELISRGVDVTEVVIECSADEYNYIKADSAKIYISSNDTESAETAARELLPGADIEVISDEP